MKSRNFSTSYNLLAKLINKVIYFLTNCFTFLMKFWMLQVRKSHFCGISAICYFMIETQVLMTVSRFFCFFLGIISWNGALLFNGGGFTFKWGRCPMGRVNFDGGFSKKTMGWGGCPPCLPSLWKTLVGDSPIHPIGNPGII